MTSAGGVVRRALPFALAIGLWLVPVPEGLTAPAWHLFAIFVSAIFSVLNTVLLKPLPYPEPDRLIAFLNTSPQGSGPGASPAKFNLWRRAERPPHLVELPCQQPAEHGVHIT